MPKNAVPRKTGSRTSARGVLYTCVVAMLSACGSGGGDSAPDYTTPRGQIASVDVSLGDTSVPADGVDKAVLQENAARNAAAGINVNLVGLQSLSASTSTLATLASAQPGSLLDDAITTGGTESAGSLLDDALSIGLGGLQSSTLESLTADHDNSLAELDTDSERLLLATLGLDESGNAISTREGNRITIDPDDAAVCAGETFIIDDTATMAPLVHCMELVSHLTVQLDATTEQTGEITYVFNQQPLLVIAYGPRNVMYELKLDALHQVQMLSEQLAGGSGSETTIMYGAIRLVASVENDSAGSESGTLALAIPEPLYIERSDGGRMTLAPSTVFTITHDESHGLASLNFGLGALEFLFADVDSVTGISTGDMVRISLGGLSGRYELTDHGQQLVASNLGLVNGPMTFSAGNTSFASVSLPPFGFTLSETSSELQLNSALDFDFASQMYDSQGSQLYDSQGVSSVELHLNSPAQTVIDTQPSSSSMVVKSGGPLQLDYSFAGSGQSENGYVTWTPGNCESSSSHTQFSPISCDDTP